MPCCTPSPKGKKSRGEEGSTPLLSWAHLFLLAGMVRDRDRGQAKGMGAGTRGQRTGERDGMWGPGNGDEGRGGEQGNGTRAGVMGQGTGARGQGSGEGAADRG